MPYEGAFQTTILGRTIRFVTRGKWLKYPDELELPEDYRPTPSGGGEKRERWRSIDDPDRRWRGSSRSRANVPQVNGRHGPREVVGIDRSSSDDTVVESGEEEHGGSGRATRTGSNEKERDPNLVDWYSETDQENPYVRLPSPLLQFN
jgi:hypothetical protein